MTPGVYVRLLRAAAKHALGYLVEKGGFFPMVSVRQLDPESNPYAKV